MGQHFTLGAGPVQVRRRVAVCSFVLPRAAPAVWLSPPMLRHVTTLPWKIIGSTLVLTCCKGDCQSQWTTPIFGPSQLETLKKYDPIRLTYLWRSALNKLQDSVSDKKDKSKTECLRLMSSGRITKKWGLMLHCYLRQLVPSVVIGFNHECFNQ